MNWINLVWWRSLTSTEKRVVPVPMKRKSNTSCEDVLCIGSFLGEKGFLKIEILNWIRWSNFCGLYLIDIIYQTIGFFNKMGSIDKTCDQFNFEICYLQSFWSPSRPLLIVIGNDDNFLFDMDIKSLTVKFGRNYDDLLWYTSTQRDHNNNIPVYIIPHRRVWKW